jgi:uncharacterized protein YecE (DUF72 family)
MSDMAIQVGLGSWADPDYVGLLYPPGLPSGQRLSGYAMWFSHVEVNATYYRTPAKAAVKKWIEETPPGFIFDIRLHRIFSQSPQKAATSGRLLPLYLENLQPLFEARRFGAFLLVLSPNFSPGRHQLEELDPLVGAVRPHPLAVELRHADWVNEKNRSRTLEFFRDRRLTWVAVDMPRIEGSELMPPVDEVTQPDLAYLRLHGRNPNYLEAKSAAERHIHAYSEAELKEITQRVRHLASRAKNVRVVANNHYTDFAPKTALRLQQLLELD